MTDDEAKDDIVVVLGLIDNLMPLATALMPQADVMDLTGTSRVLVRLYDLLGGEG